MEQPDHLLAEARRYGYTEDGQVWLLPFMHLPARRVGEVKDSNEESLRYFAQRFELFRAKVEELLQKIEEAENKGSFLAKTLYLKEQVGHYDALGDFESLHRRLSAAEEHLGILVVQNREKNLAIKTALAEEAEALRDTIDFQAATERIKELRQTWIKTGPVDKPLIEGLEDRFRAAVDAFMNRKRAFLADRKAMTNRAQDKYLALIRQSEALRDSESFEDTTRKLKQLQQEWKTIDSNLSRKQANDLWTRFRAAHNHFFERLKTHIETKRAAEGLSNQPEDNLARKRALVAEADALLTRPMHEAVVRAKELQAAWKKVGPVRGEESDRVWEQFIAACDKVFELSSLEHYIRKRQLAGLALTTLVEQVNARVQALREFIKGDQQELLVLEENLGKLSPSAGNDTFRTLLQGKIRAFERKIRTKNQLIAMIQKRLTA